MMGHDVLRGRARSWRRSGRGFTLMEMLIVVAIIAILVAVAIPIFTGQLERSREATDLANVRSAYAELTYAAMADDANAKYHDKTIKQADGSFKVVVEPLAQREDGWSTDVSQINIGSVPSNEWYGTPTAEGSCTLTFDPNSQTVAIDWRGYDHMSLMELHNVDNDARIAKDQETLKALGQAILAKGWTKDELNAKLGILTGGGLRIADYYQLKTGSFDGDYSSAGFKITANNSGELMALLQSVGYNAGDTLASSPAAASNVRNSTDTTYSNSLFYSDQLATNNYNNNGTTYDINATKRSIIIQDIKTDSSGKVTSFTMYSKAMDNQANMSQQDMAKFRFTIK